MSLEVLVSVWAVAMVIAAAACFVIARPLLIVLTEICGGRERARFWTVYACALTVATPLLAVSTPGLLDGAAAAQGGGPVLQRAVFYALAGVIFALLMMGRAVWRPIALTLRASRDPRREEAQP